MSAPGIQPAELGFFVALATAGSLSAAARNLGITTPAVSKRLAQMEARIGMPLVTRTTRRMSLTPEGEVFLERARRILGEIDDLDQLLTQAKGRPSGLLRVNATLGFGRMHIAPAISEYVRAYPDVDVQLQLSADPPPLNEDLFDVCVRFGEPPDARIIARKVAPNRRLLCASPAYLQQHGVPQTPAELARHNCIGIRQGSDAYGVWRLTSGKGAKARTETVHVRGNLTTNDGEIAVNWALEGHGIVMRAEWDIERYLNSGRLVQVLPHYATPEADIYAVYHQRHQLSSRIRLFVDYLAGRFGQSSRSPR
ncbi:LysR family transcriptional regulator [Ralstonia solanacearum]|uniref:LysR family transcriptional regulator n=1 Tax=Ralstonia solanacearum TaxID=305 RepID=A0AAW5ZVW6_RALSL|nr:LysR family transcriptional regulator [Ralstonia solanacearum]MBB6592839.1 LysR family transcriptional regulator [Ralstonia solanacearum]MBB6597065.1 LysR family transcriptional regulator [Ralstonia solanacearum]MDB0544117.1 LysR family transcriptional regulator [Ralstonia solanacearum]MDB0553947.1 LysR family transcriptional regulator [Ralstonia solanacearum]MDB0558899.1 LysR family transcriptional regulator [Ralstonia solanacearum]